jgi:hypothetical protein
MGPGLDPNLDPKLSGEQLQLAGLDTNQILSLLRHLPGIFNKVWQDTMHLIVVWIW